MNPLISVIVAVYNTEKYLKKCFDSIISQTYSNLEIILVDDGSTDNSVQICEQYLKEDARFQLLTKENGGQGSARNLALGVVKGDYIGFIDSDDFIASDMYEHLVSLAIKENADIVGCETYKIDQNDNIEFKAKTQKNHTFNNFEAIGALINDTNILDTSTCNKLFKANILKDLRFPEVRAFEDDEFIYKAFCFSKKIIQSPEPKYYYLTRENSTMTSYFNLNKLALHIVQKNIADFSKIHCSQFYDIFVKLTASKQMYCYYQLLKNKSLDPSGEIKLELRNLILSNYNEYMKNPIMGKNKIALALFKFCPSLAKLVFKIYFK